MNRQDKTPGNVKISGKSAQKNTKQSVSLRAGGAAVIVILSVCVVLFVAKGFFGKDDMYLPDDVYTGTINTNQTTPTAEIDAEVSGDKSESENNSEKSTDSLNSNSSQPEESSIGETIETAFVNQYAYLHTEPDEDAENIVCMSPNIEVNVLEKLENGYWKVTFLNIDGQKTGYVWNEYLQPSPLS